MAKRDSYTPFNKTIDNILLANPTIHANKSWLMQQIADYVAELDLLSTGIDYKELGLSERREKQKPTSILISNSGTIANGPFDFTKSEESLAIAHLKLRGVMRLENGLSTRGVRSLISDIRAANNSGNFSAILLEVNSGGGEGIAGQELKNAIVDSNLPVYTFGQLIGSAALHATLPSTNITLSGNSSEMGSIGSMVTIDREFIKFYKKNYQEIYSKTSPKKNIEFRQLLQGKTDLLEEYVTENDKLFMQEVEKYRKLSKDTANDTLKGAMFFAEEAVERGLADNIATFEQTLQSIANDLASTSNSNNNNSFKINSKMEIKVISDTWKAIMNQINRTLGTKLQETATPDDVVKVLEAAPSLEDFKASVVSEATTAINSLIQGQTDKITNLEAKITELEKANSDNANADTDLQEQVQALTNQVEALQSANTELTSKNNDLVNQIAEITGKPVVDGQTGEVKRQNTAGKFSLQVAGLQEVTNTSKYSGGKKTA